LAREVNNFSREAKSKRFRKSETKKFRISEFDVYAIESIPSGMNRRFIVYCTVII
jgi:hypothetical protein